jgi:hypothetical protein
MKKNKGHWNTPTVKTNRPLGDTARTKTGETAPDDADLYGDDAEDTAVNTEGFGPWLTILYRPRKTLHRILLAEPGRDVFLLCYLEGYALSLSGSMLHNNGDKLTVIGIFLWSLVSALVYMLFKIYGLGSVVYWSGRWLGGSERVDDIRSALAWSAIPNIWALAFWIPAFCFLQEELFTTHAPRLESTLYLAAAYTGFEILLAVLSFYSLVLLIACLATAQKFSILRAVGNLLLSLPLLLVPLLALGALVFLCARFA